MKSMCSCRAALAATLAFFTILAASACGDTIALIQEFEVNEPPVIEAIRVDDLAGNELDLANIGNGVPMKVTVIAHDPEGDAVSYEISGPVVYNNLVITSAGCSFSAITQGVSGGDAVILTIAARDSKNASSTTTRNLGTGLAGPTLIIGSPSQPAIKSTVDTTMEFWATSFGLYRIIESDDIPDLDAAKAVTGALFEYDPYPSGDTDEDGNPVEPVRVPLILNGAASASAGTLKLSAGNGQKKIWVVFWDNLKQYAWQYGAVTVDDESPEASAAVPANGAKDVPLSTTISFSITDNDALKQSTLASALQLVPATGVVIGTPTVTGNVVSWPVSGLAYNTNYTASLAGVSDRAGNALAGTISTAFKTDVGPVTGVTLNKSTTVISTGGSETLYASVSPADADNTAVTWSSSKTSVATVNSAGVVTAQSAGSAVITVTTVDGGKTAACTVTVTNSVIPVTGVSLPPDKTLNVGSTLTISATITPSDATNKNVSWSSSAVTVASINVAGTITGVSPGTSVITATTQDGGFTDTLTITVKQPVTGVTLDQTSMGLIVGGTGQLTATVLPANATNKNVTWTTSASGVATVSSTGLVTAVGQGNATVKVITADGSFTATCNVTVSLPTAIAPVITGGGVYDEENATVSMSCATSGAAIRYTTDGTTPTASSTLYTAPIVLSDSKTVNAAAFKAGMNTSNVTSAQVIIRRWEYLGTAGFTTNTVTNVVLDTQLSGLKSSLMVGFAENNGTDVRGSIMRYSGSTWGYLTRLAIPNIFTQRFTSPLAGMGLDFSAGGTDETWMSLITSGNAGYIYAQNGTSMGTPVAVGTGLKDMVMSVIQGRLTTDIYLCRQTTANVVSVLKNGVALGTFPSKKGDKIAMVVYGGKVYVAMRDATDSPATSWPWVYMYPNEDNEWEAVGGSQILKSAVSDLALYVGSGGHLIAYADTTQSNRLFIRKYNIVTEDWDSVGTVAVSTGAASSIQLKLDANAVPYVVYTDAADGRAHMKRWKGVLWKEIGSCSGTSAASNIGFTLWSDNPCVGYRDGSASNKLTVRVLR